MKIAIGWYCCCLVMLVFLSKELLAEGSNRGADRDEIVAALQRIQPPTFRDASYSILDYEGCAAGNSANCAPAFARAVDHAAEQGGGRVVVPPGTFFVKGPIHLQSNVNLVLEEHAKIVFSADPADYLPVVLTRFEGVEIWNYSPLIYARQSTNVAVTGRGTIDGQGSKGFQKFRRKQRRDQNLVRDMGNQTIPLQQRVFGHGHYLRPSMIQFFNCSNVLVEGVTILDSTFWVIHPVYSRNVIVRGVTVDSVFINSDGTDPDSCRDVLIENNTYNTGDDCISIKSGRDADGWRVGIPSENIIVRNIRCNSSTNAICIGSELSGGVRNVLFENIAIGHAGTAIEFKSNMDRGGAISGVTVRNVTASSTHTYLGFTNNYHSYRGGQSPTVFEKIDIVDCVGEQVNRNGISLIGLPQQHIRNVHISNFTIDRTFWNTIVVKNTDCLILDNVRMNGDPITIHYGTKSAEDSVLFTAAAAAVILLGLQLGIGCLTRFISVYRSDRRPTGGYS